MEISRPNGCCNDLKTNRLLFCGEPLQHPAVLSWFVMVLLYNPLPPHEVMAQILGQAFLHHCKKYEQQSGLTTGSCEKINEQCRQISCVRSAFV